MSILIELVALYERMGFHITTGLDIRHGIAPEAEFTCIIKDGKMLTGNLGISPKELYFFETALGAPGAEGMYKAWKPRGVYIVGHSFGWSSFAISMLCPDAKVVSIDIGMDDFTSEWIERSQRIAAIEGLSIETLKASSPQDTPNILGNGGPLDGIPLDLVFIDGFHEPNHVRMDLDAVAPYMHPGTVIVCHDVMLFGLHEAVDSFAIEHGLTHKVLWSTPSGISVLMGARAPLNVMQAVYVFGGSELAQNVVEALKVT